MFLWFLEGIEILFQNSTGSEILKMLSLVSPYFASDMVVTWVNYNTGKVKNNGYVWNGILVFTKFLQLSWRIPLQDTRSFVMDPLQLTRNHGFPIISLIRPKEIAYTQLSWALSTPPSGLVTTRIKPATFCFRSLGQTLHRNHSQDHSLGGRAWSWQQVLRPGHPSAPQKCAYPGY